MSPLKKGHLFNAKAPKPLRLCIFALSFFRVLIYVLIIFVEFEKELLCTTAV